MGRGLRAPLQHSNTPTLRLLPAARSGARRSNRRHPKPGEGSPLQHAKWIWHRQGDPAMAAPVGYRFFRRLLVLDAERGIASARMAMTADNASELWVNGQRAGAGQDASQAFRMDVTRWLKPGTNLLAVAGFNAHDEPNPAGLIGALHIQFRDGGTPRSGHGRPVGKRGDRGGAVAGRGESHRLGCGDGIGSAGHGPFSCAGRVQTAGLRVPGLWRHHERARADGCAAGLRCGCQPPLHPSACGGLQTFTLSRIARTSGAAPAPRSA